MSNILHINRLNFSYDTIKILNQIELSVKPGEFISIVGPNGSGKTTLLRHLGKLIAPPKNMVYINGRDIANLSPKAIANDVSLLAQHNFFDYAFNAYDSDMMGRFVHMNVFGSETKKDCAIVKQCMKNTNTWQFKDRAITTLSGGERQRIALARAMAQDTKIMLLDEPITFLDIHHQIDMLKMIKTHAVQQKKTIIAVLHDLNFALKFSDRLLLLANGEIVESGSPTDVLTKDNIKRVYDIDVILHHHDDSLKFIEPIIRY